MERCLLGRQLETTRQKIFNVLSFLFAYKVIHSWVLVKLYIFEAKRTNKICGMFSQCKRHYRVVLSLSKYA